METVAGRRRPASSSSRSARPLLEAHAEQPAPLVPRQRQSLWDLGAPCRERRDPWNPPGGSTRRRV